VLNVASAGNDGVVQQFDSHCKRRVGLELAALRGSSINIVGDCRHVENKEKPFEMRRQLCAALRSVSRRVDRTPWSRAAQLGLKQPTCRSGRCHARCMSNDAGPDTVAVVSTEDNERLMALIKHQQYVALGLCPPFFGRLVAPCGRSPLLLALLDTPGLMFCV
jgi:hypothetical protein